MVAGWIAAKVARDAMALIGSLELWLLIAVMFWFGGREHSLSVGLWCFFPMDLGLTRGKLDFIESIWAFIEKLPCGQELDKAILIVTQKILEQSNRFIFSSVSLVKDGLEMSPA